MRNITYKTQHDEIESLPVLCLTQYSSFKFSTVSIESLGSNLSLANVQGSSPFFHFRFPPVILTSSNFLIAPTSINSTELVLIPSISAEPVLKIL